MPKYTLVWVWGPVTLTARGWLAAGLEHTLTPPLVLPPPATPTPQPQPHPCTPCPRRRHAPQAPLP